MLQFIVNIGLYNFVHLVDGGNIMTIDNRIHQYRLYHNKYSIITIDSNWHNRINTRSKPVLINRTAWVTSAQSVVIDPMVRSLMVVNFWTAWARLPDFHFWARWGLRDSLLLSTCPKSTGGLLHYLPLPRELRQRDRKELCFLLTRTFVCNYVGSN